MSILVTKELIVEARQIRTFVIRVVLILSLFSLVWLGNFDIEGNPHSSGQMVGLVLFMQLALGLVAMVMLLAPSIAVPSLISEVRQGSFDILLSSGFPEHKIVQAKVISKTIVPLSIVLACAPMMAMVTYYGGLSPVQAAAVLVHVCSLTFLFAATGVSVGLMTPASKSPTAAIIKWILGYNIVTLMLTFNPFIAVAICVMDSGYVRIIMITALNLLGGFRAMHLAIRELRKPAHGEDLEMWLRDTRVPFARAIFYQRESYSSPITWKELQEGKHASLRIVSLVAACFYGVLAVCVYISAFSGPDVAATVFRGVLYVVMVQLLFSAVLLISETLSSERETNTLGLLCLTNLTPRRIIMGKIRALRTTLRPLVICFWVYAAGLGMTAALSDTNRLMGICRWLVGLAAVISLITLFGAISVCWSAGSKTRARAMQGALATLALGTIIPMVVAPTAFVRTLVTHIGILNLVAAWPHDVEIVPALCVTVLATGLSCWLMRISERLIGRVPG
jgi:hypothetical protein